MHAESRLLWNGGKSQSGIREDLPRDLQQRRLPATSSRPAEICTFGGLASSHFRPSHLATSDNPPHVPEQIVMVSSVFADRPIKKLVLFDVDGTLSLARQVSHPKGH